MSIDNQLEKFKYKSVIELPKHIQLDICNKCQLNCVKCWMRRDEDFIKKNHGFGYVNFETF